MAYYAETLRRLQDEKKKKKKDQVYVVSDEKGKSVNQERVKIDTAMAPIQQKMDTMTGYRTSGMRTIAKQEDSWIKNILQVPEVMKDNFKRFDDGYQFGDITKTTIEGIGDTLLTAGGTIADAGMGITKGILNVGEGIGDAITYGTAQVLDWTGKDERANELRERASKDIFNDAFKKPQSFVNQASVLGDTSDNITEGIGYMASIWATGQIGGAIGGAVAKGSKATKALSAAGKAKEIAKAAKIGTTLGQSGLIFSNSTGTNMADIYDQYGVDGVTDGEAWGKSLGSAAIETTTELMLGMFGNADAKIVNGMANRAKTALGSVIARAGGQAFGEGLEEIVSYAGNYVWDRVVDAASKGEGAKFAQEWSWEDLWEQAGTAALTALVMGGGQTSMSALNNKTATNTWGDAINETARQQNTSAQLEELEDQKAKLEKKLGQNLSQTEIDKTFAEMQQIDSQISELNNQVSLTNTTAPDDTVQVEGLQNAITEKTQELQNSQDAREQQIIQEEINNLQEELNEATNAQQFTSGEQLQKRNFTYEATDNEYKAAVYESASKHFNDTKETHTFVDVVAKIAEDRGTKYEFVNSEEIKARGYDIANASVNGLVTEDGSVLLNVDSRQGLDFILGHETTHLLEGTQEYQALQDLVIEYAKQKGIYEDRTAKLHSLYKGKGDINAELTSDLVGELLFTDQAFVENLSVKQPTLFEKIKNFISDLIVKLKGTEQEKQLRQLQRSFEKAYKTQGTQTSTEVKYSLSEDGKIVDSTTNKEVELEATETGTHGTLMAIHNLTESKLKGILELGGFPVPSIAITDTRKNNHTQFGDISVIFDKATIDPLNYQNEVYDRDVWSPVFPSVEYDINNADIKKYITKNLDYDYKDEIISRTITSYMYESNLSDKINRNGVDQTLKDIKNDNSMKYLYKTSVEKDSNYKPETKEMKFSNYYENETLKRFIDSFNKTHDMSLQDFFYHYINYKDMELSESERTQLDNQIIDAIRPEIEEYWNRFKDRLTEEQYKKAVQEELDSAIDSYGKWYDFLMNSSTYSKNGDYQTVDTDATLNNIDKYINKQDYEKWVDSTFGEMFKNLNKGIRNNKDPYTNSGNRRSFKQLHDDYSLSNIVRALTAKDTKGGEGGFTSGSFGEIQAKMANQFNSIEDIKNASDRLMSSKEANELLEPLKEKIKNNIQELSGYYHSKSYYDNSFEIAAEAISEFAGKSKQTIANFKKVLNSFYNFDVDSIPGSLYSSIINDLNSLKNIKTDYFEAKPQRAVELNEAQAIIIPNTASAAIKQQLQESGLKYYEYDPNIEGDRQRVINQFDDLKFSLSAQNEDIAPVGNIFGEDLKVQLEEVIAPLQETVEKLTEQVQTLQENVAPVVEQVKPEQVIQSTKPTFEEVKNLIDIRDNKSGSEYASAFFALRDKYGQVNLYKSLNEYYATGTVTDEDYTAPTSQEIVEQQGQEAFETITDNEAPRSFEDTVFDVFENEGFGYETESKVESPFDTRDIDEVGKRNVKAYQYENPEVRPYFQAEAENMMYDLNNTIKGEKNFNDQLYYDTNGEQGWYGTTRQTTEAIAYLKDKYGYSYAQIEKGLNDIIEDNGKENNAVAKRIEFMLDERLRDGYTTSDGIPIPPNEEYIKFLEEKQITEYNREVSNTLTDENVPPEQTRIDLEPKIQPSEQVIPMAENIAQNRATGQFELKIDESMPVQENTAQNQNTGLSDTSTEAQEQAKIAQILSEAPTKQNKDQRMWARARAAFFDKGSVFEDISLKTKNRELEAKWDYSLPSEARAQNVLFNGYREFDSLTKTITQTSKGLYDIQAEVGDRVQEFSEYLYHKHNIDRMSIEANAQARMAELQETVLKDYDLEGIEKLSRKRQPTNIDKKNGSEQLELDLKIQENLINSAKEYMRLSEAKNKPVFGDSVTAEVSQKIVDEYEMNNPEFMDWANDVYDYNKANLKELVKSGVISQETADQFAEIYPHYVPIARANVNGNAINVPLDTNRTGVNAPIARAKGGSQDILPLFDTMARRTLQTYRATAKNNFGVELKNTLNSTIDNQQTSVDEILENVDQQEGLLQEGKNGQNPTFTVFENGEKVTYEITQDIYDALKPVSEGLKGNILKGIPNKISNFHRGLLTEYNPVFMLTNAIKDAQDILLNSQHATKTYAKLPEAYAQIIKKGYWYQEYMSHGGEQNSYFDSQEGTFDTERKGISKVLDLPPLKQISQLNNFIEVAPRLAEYIASREAGRSVETSMLDAARVTTNFKAGGDITKWINRNGATFLNASIQGAMQQVRNVREANAKGLRGYANLAAKFALAGLPAMILNGLLWEDDDDYEELSDYVKQNYYIVGKYGDGNFIRIPKGRMITVVQEGLNQMTNLVTGNDEADLGQFLEIVGNNIAPNNPIENNVLAPIIQAVKNKTWYGGDLVPTRLQDEPIEEQYDETTDSLSIFLGQKLGISPYKINYVLDQYSGGIGDVFLPMMTQQAETGSDSLLEELMSPLTNKFTVDSVMKNQNVSDLYSKSEELASKANSTSATDEDILKNKYLNSIKSEMNELYKEKREIQNSSLSNSEKYAQAREIQDQINSMARNAMDSYEGVRKSGDYAKVGNKEYYLKDDTWTKVKDEELSELNSLGMNLDDKNTYFNLKTEINSIKDSTVENKKAAIATTIRDTNFTDEQKAYVYGKNYSSDETLDMVLNTGMSFNEYLNYASQEFVADKDSDGKSINGSRKKKVISYINSLNLSIPQKAMLIRKEYSTFDDYNEDIISYVIDLDLTYEEKKAILEEVDMKVSADGRISW